jgi:hypothetical protein
MSDINPQIRKPLDDRMEWINHVTELAQRRDHRAVWNAIADVDAEHLHSLVYVLILARVDDLERVKSYYAEWMRERLNEWPTLSEN